ncbi:MAG: hypothetical protein HZA78_03720 [Candidatus Schekmanbacteria bacterium]|nr:hypothetical protein [Candidatus Schekmanbacteria bacterium]
MGLISNIKNSLRYANLKEMSDFSDPRYYYTFLSNKNLINSLTSIGRIMEGVDKIDFKSDQGDRILFFSLKGWVQHTIWEALIAHGLILRGCQCKFIICDGSLPICDFKNYHYYKSIKTWCSTCYHSQKILLEKFKLPYDSISQYISKNERRQIAALLKQSTNLDDIILNGHNLASIVEPSLLRFLLKGSLDNSKEDQSFKRNFIESAAILDKVHQNALDLINPDVVFCVNGLFFGERLALLQARQRGKRVVTYERSPNRKNAVILSHNKPVVEIDLTALWEQVVTWPLTPKQEAEIDRFINSRIAGNTGCVSYMNAPRNNVAELYNILTLSPEKKTAVLFTNVLWDTAIYKKDLHFKDMREWVCKTIDYFVKNPQFQLIIRIHPAEIKVKSSETREKVGDILKQKYPRLPKNICIIYPDQDINSYLLLEAGNLVLVYTTTLGLEAATRGIPVIVSANTHYRGKGFTFDISSNEEYYPMLSNLLQREGKISDEWVNLARKYLYFFFYRYSIIYDAVDEPYLGLTGQFKIKNIHDLAPGRDKNFDLICDGIISGKEFFLFD